MKEKIKCSHCDDDATSATIVDGIHVCDDDDCLLELAKEHFIDLMIDIDILNQDDEDDVEDDDDYNG